MERVRLQRVRFQKPEGGSRLRGRKRRRRRSSDDPACAMELGRRRLTRVVELEEGERRRVRVWSKDEGG